ncbi:hypothetical protein ACFY3U_01765 [Micromonospora sp. NPDC000089]
MKLTKLYKDVGSGGNGLENVLPGEGAVRIAAEVVLGAVERYREPGQR